MKNVQSLFAVLALALAAVAQSEPAPSQSTRRISDAGREALSRCRELALRGQDLAGTERLAAFAEAASNYERVVTGFEQEPRVAARAAFSAAELWRRHGSLALAERDYLVAARLEPERYGPRGLLGGADMQRRLRRPREALATYRRLIAGAPTAPQAQPARLAIARLLRELGRLEDAIAAARIALECARPGRPMIDACNLLALLLIASGDFDAAERALDHAARGIEGIDNGVPMVRERLQRAVADMSARRALRRARDRANRTADDAVRFEVDRQRAVNRDRSQL